MTENRYARIARDIAEGIASGRFPVGSLLPTEMELRDRYATSRHTIRAAMQELADLGLVSRRKHVGTRVEAARPKVGYNQSLASLEDLVQLAATHVRVVRGMENIVADVHLAREIGCVPGTRWLRVSSVRLDGGKAAGLPIGWTDTYVDPAYSDLRKLLLRSPKALISTLIERRYGRRSAEIRQSIRAMQLPAEVAAELKAAPNSPALRIARHYLDRAGETFEISISVHPADRFTFSMVLKRDRRTR